MRYWYELYLFSICLLLASYLSLMLRKLY